jgi:hypothetical protein
MLSHILYGQSRLAHGGLLFKARAAGFRGQMASLTIQSGVALNIACAFMAGNVFTAMATGAGDIVVTVANNTTEAQLMNALNRDATFRILAAVERASGNGSAVVAPLARTQFDVPTDGLQQHLAARIGIENWESRTLQTSGGPIGDIWPGGVTLIRSNVGDMAEYYKGKIYVGVGFQQNDRYQIQNALLDAYRRALVKALLEFDHDDLNDASEVACGYTNRMKDEAAGTRSDKARLALVARVAMRWQESAADEDGIAGGLFTEANFGLWREPLVGDVSVVDDGEALDQQLTITPE